MIQERQGWHRAGTLAKLTLETSVSGALAVSGAPSGVRQERGDKGSAVAQGPQQAKYQR